MIPILRRPKLNTKIVYGGLFSFTQGRENWYSVTRARTSRRVTIRSLTHLIKLISLNQAYGY